MPVKGLEKRGGVPPSPRLWRDKLSQGKRTDPAKGLFPLLKYRPLLGTELRDYGGVESYGKLIHQIFDDGLYIINGKIFRQFFSYEDFFYAANRLTFIRCGHEQNGIHAVEQSQVELDVAVGKKLFLVIICRKGYQIT